MIDPEIKLNQAQRVNLQAIVSMPGFEVLAMLAEAECGRFDVDLKNLSEENPNYDRILRDKHLKSKAASQLWAGIVQRVNTEIAQSATIEAAKPLNELKAEEILPDETEELLR